MSNSAIADADGSVQKIHGQAVVEPIRAGQSFAVGEYKHPTAPFGQVIPANRASIIGDILVGAGQQLEFSKKAPPTTPPAQAQIVPEGGFIAQWQKRRAEWLKRGAPAAAVTDERQVILPQQLIPKGGIIDAVAKGPIISRLREIIGR